MRKCWMQWSPPSSLNSLVATSLMSTWIMCTSTFPTQRHLGINCSVEWSKSRRSLTGFKITASMRQPLNRSSLTLQGRVRIGKKLRDKLDFNIYLLWYILVFLFLLVPGVINYLIFSSVFLSQHPFCLCPYILVFIRFVLGPTYLNIYIFFKVKNLN